MTSIIYFDAGKRCIHMNTWIIRKTDTETLSGKELLYCNSIREDITVKN